MSDPEGPKIPCSECGEAAQENFDGKMYCTECYDDLVPMDFDDV